MTTTTTTKEMTVVSFRRWLASVRVPHGNKVYSRTEPIRRSTSCNLTSTRCPL
jgi:hypothetical protein